MPKHEAKYEERVHCIYSGKELRTRADQEEECMEAPEGIIAVPERAELLEETNRKLGRQITEFSEEINRRGERIEVLERRVKDLEAQVNRLRAAIVGHIENRDLLRALEQEMGR